MGITGKYAHKLRNRFQVILTLIEMAMDDLPRDRILAYLNKARSLIEELSTDITNNIPPGDKVYLLKKDKK